MIPDTATIFPTQRHYTGITLRQEAALRLFVALVAQDRPMLEAVRVKRAWELADVWMAGEPEAK
jgi:hypothetical protein